MLVQCPCDCHKLILDKRIFSSPRQAEGSTIFTSWRTISTWMSWQKLLSRRVPGGTTPKRSDIMRCETAQNVYFSGAVYLLNSLLWNAYNPYSVYIYNYIMQTVTASWVGWQPTVPHQPVHWLYQPSASDDGIEECASKYDSLSQGYLMIPKFWELCRALTIPEKKCISWLSVCLPVCLSIFRPPPHISHHSADWDLTDRRSSWAPSPCSSDPRTIWTSLKVRHCTL